MIPEHDVGPLSFFERADQLIQAECPGRIGSDPSQRLVVVDGHSDLPAGGLRLRCFLVQVANLGLGVGVDDRPDPRL
jgi:hypothetical protein